MSGPESLLSPVATSRNAERRDSGQARPMFVWVTFLSVVSLAGTLILTTKERGWDTADLVRTGSVVLVGILTARDQVKLRTEHSIPVPLAVVTSLCVVVNLWSLYLTRARDVGTTMTVLALVLRAIASYVKHETETAHRPKPVFAIGTHDRAVDHILTTGIYGLCRHPAYLSYLLTGLSAALYTPFGLPSTAPWTAQWCLPVQSVLLATISALYLTHANREELQFLSHAQPQFRFEYAAYQKKVPFIIPTIASLPNLGTRPKTT